MKPYIAKNKRTNRPRVIIIAILLIVLLITVGLLALNRRNDKQQTVNDTPGETINFNPPTEEEKQQTEQHKENLARQQESEQNQQTSDNKKPVTPIVTDASQYGDKVEIRAYIPGIVETGGKCTFVLKHNQSELVRTIDTLAGPQSTQCDTVSIPVSEFPETGIWTLQVSYISDESIGTSTSQNVEVN